MNPPAPIVLSLVSHTNAGKTTLARTLLGRDIGEVRDAPHVTEFVEEHELLRAPDGAALILCDTPGFGDSARLARRMRLAGHPLGWLLSEVWDRWRDRAFWGTQQALRHVRERSDVVLYLVNAAEEPTAAAYVAPEMELLAWMDKPVIVLLNQLGAPREYALEQAELAAWRAHLAGHAFVREVLPLDAFARCWVQEAVLLRAVQAALPPDRRAAMQGLAAHWRQGRQATFDTSMAVLATSLARVAGTRVELDDDGVGRWREHLQRIGSAVGIGRADDGPSTRAQAALQAVASDEARQSTQRLLQLHGLDGSAEGEILARVAAQVVVHVRVDEGRAALLGGMVSGALVGLKADLASGGLTLGGGLLAGGLLGALGAAGIARGLNLVRGTERSWATWSDEALAPMVQAALLRYLAVAHFGRGRGQWSEGEAPGHWHGEVEAALAAQADAWQRAWRRGDGMDGDGGDDGVDGANGAAALAASAAGAALAARLQPLLAAAALRVLASLYPQAALPTGAESQA